MMTLLYNIIQREPSVLSRHEASMLAQALVALKILPPALFSVLRTAVAQRGKDRGRGRTVGSPAGGRRVAHIEAALSSGAEVVSGG